MYLVAALILSMFVGAATWRIARLITIDIIFQTPLDALRVWLETRHINRQEKRLTKKGLPESDIDAAIVELEESDTFTSKIAYFLSCQWCLSPWICAALIGVTWWALDGVPVPVFVWVGGLSVAGILTKTLDN